MINAFIFSFSLAYWNVNTKSNYIHVLKTKNMFLAEGAQEMSSIWTEIRPANE